VGVLNLNQIIELARGPALATDSDNRIVAWNQAASVLFAFDEKRGSIAGKRLHELVSISDVFGNPYRNDAQPFWELATQGEPTNTFEIKLLQPEGESRRLSVAAVVVLGPGESEYGVIYLLRPLHRRRRADEAIERILSMLQDHVRSTHSSDDGVDEPEPELTRREVEVLRLLAQGNSSYEIARTLNVSVHTVRTHVQHVLHKRGAHSKLEAVAKAFQARLI
jgi:DNA-binding CsgD family transcriptional regulator